MNTFQIRISDEIEFFVENPDTVSMDLVHTIKNSSVSNLPVATNPIFRVGWVSQNTGKTSSTILEGSYASGFLEGEKKLTGGAKSLIAEALSVGSTSTSILILRNRISFGSRVNRSDIIPRVLSASTQANKPAFFELILNPTFSSDVVFEYVDKAGSIAETSSDQVTVTGGSVIGSLTVVNNQTLVIDVNNSTDIEAAILPGDTFVIAARVSSGSAGDMQASLSYIEDL